MAWSNPPNLLRVGVNHVTNFRNPVVRYLAFSKMGIPGATDLQLGLNESYGNFPQRCRQFYFQLTSSSGRKLTISEIRFQTDFRKVPIRLQYGFLLYCFDNFYTTNRKTRRLCTLETISRLVQ